MIALAAPPLHILAARPTPAELFAALYANGYDVIIWSATGHKWIEAKLRETGVSSHPAYKITACMVRAATR